MITDRVTTGRPWQPGWLTPPTWCPLCSIDPGGAIRCHRCPAGAEEAEPATSTLVPTTLIWGRHDLAAPLAVADAASARYGLPLHVIDQAGDDPVLDQPTKFLGALRAALAPAGNAVGSA